VNGERRSSCKSFPLPCGVSVQEMAASFFLIRLGLGGSPVGLFRRLFRGQSEAKSVVHDAISGGRGGSIPSRGTFDLSPYLTRV
jgi:hypothetical protein